MSAASVPGVAVRAARSRARWRACRSWLEALGGSRASIYAPGPPALVTGVTRLRVRRPAADRSQAATRVAARRSQVEIPGLPHQVGTEAAMRLFVHQAEAGLFVDTPGRLQHVVRPQGELAVADLAGEAHALLHEAFADAEAARPGLDEEQTQPGDRLRFLDAKHRAHVLTVQLRDPAALPLRVVVADELGDDVRDQRLELLAPAVFPGVQRAVALNDPPHVAGSMASQDGGSGVLGPGAEQPFDGAHRRHEALLLRLRQVPQQGADVVVRVSVELGEGLPAAGRQGQDALPPVAVGGLAVEQAAHLEAPQHAAEIARIEAQFPAEFGRGGGRLMRQLIEHAGCGEGEGAPQEVLVQQADLLRVEAVEAPHGGYALGQGGRSHRGQASSYS